ncbi:extracellular solute-binding protein [Kribbella pittospori]|uniref:Extracellular solute-binding protein n=2 Tax=Kribbella pittospori TaxID=722689 RepID=A0A4R0KLZ5_9ACTN|nr:extracellular solute-binding protein [Kribbella pittospori]
MVAQPDDSVRATAARHPHSARRHLMRVNTTFGRLAAGTLVVALGTGLAGCGKSGDSGSGGSGDGKVTISVMGLPPATKAATRQAFLDRVAEFEKANPTIHIEPSDAPWDVQTFAAKMAGGRAETVLEIPLTEPPGLIDRKQVADISAEAKALPEYAALDPRIMDTLSRDGKIYGLPESMYALGLLYNRKLFAAAGLDPDKPPATWDEFRADAKQIHDRTGQIGYAPMSINNGGGWHLTAMTYANGGTIEKQNGDKQAAGFTDGDATAQALNLLHAMRFEDNSLGTNMLRKSEDIAPQFAAGKIGMQINGPSAYGSYLSLYKGKAEDFGAAALPQGAGNATLIGGTVLMVSAKATADQRAAAVKWMEFQYLKPAYDPDIAAAQAKANAADKLPVGVPGLPIYDQSVVAKVDAAIKPYVNVTTAHFQPYVDGTAKLKLVPEPPVGSQDVYAALDPVVQAALTRQNADIPALLKTASGHVDSILQQH